MPNTELTPESLSTDSRDTLLSLAYHTVCDLVMDRHIRHIQPLDPHLAALTQHAGAFVTLSHHGELRGCIGRILADQPVWQVVQQMAVAAAENDPRFEPLSPAELNDLEVEISVLSPLRTINHVDEIEVGKHGLLITKGFHRGLLLPQVATERGWDRATFLDATCEKAGLPAGTWRRGATIEIFSALVFSKTFSG